MSATVKPGYGHKNAGGFTIIELMIATVVFSMILLVITAAILQFSRQYYKGVVSSSTQTASRAIMDDVTRSLQFSGGTVAKLGDNGWCIGTSKRYSFVLHKQLMDNATGAQVPHAIVSDTVSGGCSTGTQPLDVSRLTNLNGLTDARELLGERMRLADFDIKGESPVYTITVRVVYGDDDLLTDPNSKTAACKTDIGSQFCAVSELTTTVTKRAQ